MPRSTPRAEARKQIKARRWRLPPVSISQILAWADEHFEQTGRWPNTMSGRVRGTHEEKWKNLDNALRQGTRGLRKGDSLARLLLRARGVRNPADPPPLTAELILAWADEHHANTGQWPIADSGDVNGIPDETWNALDMTLRIGNRGLPGGDSLARLLERERGVRNKRNLPRLSIKKILRWCDQYHAQSGQWPTDSSEPLAEMKDPWPRIDASLRAGMRGLPGGDSLPQLLARERGARNIQSLPRLSNKQILAWADDHHRRTGAWPNRKSGAVLAAPDESWGSIVSIIIAGGRGLPGNDSLARLLARERGVRNRKGLPPHTIKQILAWADQYHAEHKKWPNTHTGSIAAAPGETWTAVNVALAHGTRGLPGGDSLAQLLARRRGVRNQAQLPRLTLRQILAWADDHFDRHGMWPTGQSGPIDGAPGETWMAVQEALYNGGRGLRSGWSLPRLLKKHRGVSRHVRRPSLTIEAILNWADAFHQRHGRWPKTASGEIPEAPGETWSRIQIALYGGKRGLPRGWSLARLLMVHRGVRSVQHLPKLRIKQILEWVDGYHKNHGRWPSRDSGAISGASGETWNGVDIALKSGGRGLPGGSSLARLLDKRRR